MQNCDNCGGKKWLAKINRKTGEQEYHKVKIDDAIEYNLMIYKCWRCGHVQHEVTPFVPIPARGASVLYLDVEVSKSQMFNYGLRVPSGYISPDNLIHEYYIICWSAAYIDGERLWHDCVSPAEARRWTDEKILGKIQRLMQSADIIAGHNVDIYDIKRLNTRFLLNGLEPVTEKKTIDTLKIARRKFKFESNRLDYISTRLGFRPKDDITNEDWNRIVATGDKETLQKVDTYCQGDVKNGMDIYRKLSKYSGKKDFYGTVALR
jgi:hypothetical protein